MTVGPRGQRGRGPRSVSPAVALLMAAGLLGACSPVAGDGRIELRVAAAASLRDAVEGLTATYATGHPGVTFSVTSDSSAALRTQVEQGAPVDVFLSADARNPQALADGGLTAGDPVPFAANTLALVVPAGNPAGIAGFEDLARPGVRIVAAGEAVPITAYAEQVLDNLAATMADGETWRAAVDANTVSREDNVAAVLARIELGEGDAGFVYATDGADNAKVESIPIPADANARASYVGAVIRASAHPSDAAAFLAWVAGPEGQSVLRPLGFLAP